MLSFLVLLLLVLLLQGSSLQFNKRSASSSSKLLKSNDAISIYRKKRNPEKIKKGGMFDVGDNKLILSYKSMVSVLKSEEDALKAVSGNEDIFLSIHFY